MREGRRWRSPRMETIKAVFAGGRKTIKLQNLKIDDFRLQLLLLRLIALAQQFIAFIIQAATGIVLVNFHKEAFQLGYTLLISAELFPAGFELFAALQPQPAFHYCTEMAFVPQDIFCYKLDMLQDKTAQRFLANIMRTAFVLSFPVQRAIEESVFRLVVVGSAIV